jgi:hypothetical protein
MRPILRRTSVLCTSTAALLLAAAGAGADTPVRPYTYFESFESGVENTSSDPRDLNRNGILDCGRDNDCSTITPCAADPGLCDEWTLPLVSDSDLRLANEATPASNPNLVYFKSGASIFPATRGQASIVGAGSTEICPADQDNGYTPGGVRAGLMDWHIHTVKTPDINGTDSSRAGNMPKAFRGRNSLHWGRHVAVSRTGGKGAGRGVTVYGDTYCVQCMNAFALDREGGLTLNSRSTRDQPLRLSFYHIAEFCDDECATECKSLTLDPDTADEVGIVEVRHAPAGTSDFGMWERIVPDVNPYDGVQDTLYFTPTYEPIDDTNPEAAPGIDPGVTMCSPLTVYVAQGSAKGTDPACGDGNGDGWSDCGNVTSNAARGEAGVGIWARTSFDLRHYAGKRIQVRFITTTADGFEGLFTSYLETSSGGPFTLPESGTEDGWYIDDIQVSGLVQ